MVATLPAQIGTKRAELTDQLELSFNEILYAASVQDSRVVDKREIAMAEAEIFIAFANGLQENAVREHAMRRAGQGIPGAIIFRLYDGLQRFYHSYLSVEVHPASAALIDRYCAIYVESYTAVNHGEQRPHEPEAETDDSWLNTAIEISRLVGSILNPDELLNEVIEYLREFSGSSSVALFVIDDSDGWAEVQTVSSAPGKSNYAPGYRLKIGDSSCAGQCIDTGETQIAFALDQSSPINALDSLNGVMSMLVLPMISHGQVIGAVSFHSEQLATFDDNTQMRLRLTVDQIANAIENARLYHELSAYADTLENLVARRTLEIRQAKEYTEAILDNSPDAIVFTDISGAIKTANGAFRQLFQQPEGDLPNVRLPQLASTDFQSSVEQALQSVVTTGQVSRFRITAVRADGSIFDLDAALAPSVANGQISGVVCNLRDVTDLVQADKLVKASLREKEVLLQEIHHRVKNNLQIVASLINLQTSRVEDKAASQALRESQSRIHTMALIHERLYRSTNLASVDFVQYIRELMSFVTRSYTTQIGRIQVGIEADEMQLDLNTAIPCGLIVNELVSNAFKHAFPDGASGTIKIAMHGTSDQHVLSVWDNGVGFPAGFNLQSTSTLGLQLVQRLVSQLQGTLEIHSNPNETVITIRCPIAASNLSV